MNYRLSYKEATEYTDAMEYLIKHFVKFPSKVPPGGLTPEISVAYHKNHRFVLTPDGEIVFADCIVPGINESEFEDYRRSVFEPKLCSDSRSNNSCNSKKGE